MVRRVRAAHHGAARPAPGPRRDSVNHSGDSDSTGAVRGNLVADDLCPESEHAVARPPDRYPGC